MTENKQTVQRYMEAGFSHHIVDPGFAGHPVSTVNRMTEEADVVIAQIRRLINYLVQTAVFVLFGSVGVHAAYAQDTAAVAGCYAAEPALTYSAAGVLERGDSSWVIAQLSDGGVARRPLLKPDRDRRSSWHLAGDTLDVYFFDGLVGWRLRLTRVSAGWSGVATYLTDGIVAGEPPFRRAIMLTRRQCP